MKRSIVGALLLAASVATLADVASAQWSPNGVVLIGMPDGKGSEPAICADGSGGAFIAWQDTRSGSHIYAQHLDHSGKTVPGWPSTGLRVSMDSHTQDAPVLASDGTGGLFVCWNDLRIFNYAQQYMSHISANGTIDVRWPATGQGLTQGTSNHYSQLFSDGAGGIYAVFVDGRDYNVTNVLDIYAQRLSGAGIPVTGWPASGRPVVTCPCLDRDFNFHAMRDISGGVFVSWDEYTTRWRARAQRLMSDGSLAAGWDSCGRLLSPTAVLDQEVGGIAPTPGGAIALLINPGENSQFDYSFSTLGFDLNGNLLPAWAGGPKLFLSAPNDQYEPRTISDGRGGMFAAWTDGRNYNTTFYDAYVQHITSSGDPAAGWPRNGVQADNARTADGPLDLVSDGSGGVYIAFENDYPVVFASHVISPGIIAPGWNPAGEIVSTHHYDQGMDFPYLCSDGAGGAIMAFTLSDAPTVADAVFAQHISSDAPVPASLALVSSKVEPDHVTLDWFAPSAGVSQVELLRQSDGVTWESLGVLLADGSGNLIYEDRNVSPGARYAYRLSYNEAGAQHFTPAEWVQVPAGYRFALAGAIPNPASRRNVSVAFTLPVASPATLTMFDLSGRQVASADVGDLGAGEHVVKLGNEEHVAPGCYWVRLSQGSQHATVKIAVVN